MIAAGHCAEILESCLIARWQFITSTHEATPYMLWVKSLHIIFMVTWFAGLFYLPRLFVYHALSVGRRGRW